MPPTALRQTDVISIRLPRVIADEVRALAQRDLEREAVVLRRLIRVGLERERIGHVVAAG